MIIPVDVQTAYVLWTPDGSQAYSKEELKLQAIDSLYEVTTKSYNRFFLTAEKLTEFLEKEEVALQIKSVMID